MSDLAFTSDGTPGGGTNVTVDDSKGLDAWISATVMF